MNEGDEMPAWLPPVVSVDGDWKKVVARLYRIFDRDFRQVGCRLRGYPVWWDQHKTNSPYEEGFWHLITKSDPAIQDRLLDPRRAERLPWCKPTIENCHGSEVKFWDYCEAGGKTRTYIWLERWDYTIVVEKRSLPDGRMVAFLVTAFYVEGNSAKRSLQRKYERRVR